jgi:predicted DNA-binding transcriptional regulator AlpA
LTIDRHLTAEDIMVKLGISRSRAYEVMREMPRVKFGKSVRVSEAELERWLKQRTIQPLTREPLMSRTAEAAWARRVRKETKLRAAAVRLALPVGDGSTIRLTRRPR